jgi:hypothetical protein
MRADPEPPLRERLAGTRARGSLEVRVRGEPYPVAMLPNSSLAVTVTVNESPAVRVPGFPERERDEACAGLTWIWETGRESAPSLPDRVCVPEVLSFTEKFA